MQTDDARRIANDLWRAAMLTLGAALGFAAFFQLSKSPVFSAVNPFADDPVDAIGSIAVQVAFAVSVLTLARAVRFKPDAPDSYRRGRLILRGNSVALSAIAITLLADATMEIQQPMWGASIWGQLLVIGLAVVAVLACVAGLATFKAMAPMRILRADASTLPNTTDALAEALDDLWALACAALAWFSRNIILLRRPIHWVEKIGDAALDLITNMPWIGARKHPWRFCGLAGLCVGIAVSGLHGLEEGAPANLALAIFVTALFIMIEFVAVLAGFLVLGGFLGIRPPLRLHHS